MALVCHVRAARCSAVLPSASAARAFAFDIRSRRRTDVLPLRAARCNGVLPTGSGAA